LRRALALAALLLAAPACHHDDSAVLLVVVTASGTPPAVSSLDVTLTSGRAPPSNNRYAPDGSEPIMFPTTLSAELPAYATGDITIDVRADDAAGTMVATGHGGPVTIHPGERETVYVRLDCGGDACVVDGGTGNDDGGMAPPNPRCGNGRVDPGETCDTKIPAGDPGACPATCDDHIACTHDTRSGSDCTVSCAHEPMAKGALDIQKEVGAALAREVSPALAERQQHRLSRRLPIDPAAHDAYLRGRYYWTRRVHFDAGFAAQCGGSKLTTPPAWLPFLRDGE